MARDVLIEKLESLRRCVKRIDWDIVHAVSHGGLADFERYARRISAYL